MSLVYTLLGVIDAGSVASPSISVTIPAGCTKLTVSYRNGGGRTISSATLGAASLSQLGANGSHASVKTEVWQLDNPTPGTDTLTLNQSGAGSCTGEVLAWTGSATGVGSVGTVATAPTAATTLNIASASGEIPILVLAASSGSPNTITDTSSPALTLIDKRLSASGLILGGSFSGIGEADGTVATAFTIANGGGTKVALGFSIKPAAGGTTFYLTDAAASGSNHGALQQDGSAPADATMLTGWTVAGRAVGDFARMSYNTERGAGTFSTTAEPSSGPDNTLGDCFRIGPLTGSIPAGNWDLSFAVIAQDLGGTQDGRMRVRVWKSANADGSSATELTAGPGSASIVTNLTTGTAQNSALTIAMGAVTLTNEYLFIQLAWEVTGVA